jgi:geranylgeranyl pyrophosphate synthase
LRVELKRRCAALVDRLDKARHLPRSEMETHARQIVADCGLPDTHVGWTMVMLASEFWRDQVAAVPQNRRLFLLPTCTRHRDETGLPASGPVRAASNHCLFAAYRSRAEKLGYQVLATDQSSKALRQTFDRQIDAIVGLASLGLLEKALDKILPVGVPYMAVPLFTEDCCDVRVDDDCIQDMIGLLCAHSAATERTRTYSHLIRAAAKMFEPEELERLAPRHHGGPRLAALNGRGVAGLDPVAGTEAIAYDFLSKGGKHSRPFITLAVHDALTGSRATDQNGATHLETLDAAVKRVAMSIETFHKASLVHDDIEDDDAYRYGDETLHRKFGIATAINVGDYLIGMGYRLVSREAKTLGPEVVSDILDRLADAHLKLSEGQGAELLWRDCHRKQITLRDALRIYELKTAPAFEAAIFSGLRLAGPIERYLEPLGRFARHLGVAFQILNDLGDWDGDHHNKLLAAGDVLGGRPTVLWALALEGSDQPGRAELESLVAGDNGKSDVVMRVRVLYERAGVFEKAHHLIEQNRRLAEEVAQRTEPDSLRHLLFYLIDTVLAGDTGVFVPTR